MLALTCLRSKGLQQLTSRLKMTDMLPFAYKAALFILAAQIGVLQMLHPYSQDTMLRTVQSITAVHPINWQYTLRYLREREYDSSFDYFVSNLGFWARDNSLEAALHVACNTGRADVVSQLMACTNGDPQKLSLDGPLNTAVYRNQFECASVLLNDPIQRVSRRDRNAALQTSVRNLNLPISALLIQHGVSVEALHDALEDVIHEHGEFVALLLQQPGVDPSYGNNRLLLESAGAVDCSLTRLLLADDRVSMVANNFMPLRIALDLKRTEHVLLFVKAAERRNDRECCAAVAEILVLYSWQDTN